jgi:hypothetical protein
MGAPQHEFDLGSQRSTFAAPRIWRNVFLLIYRKQSEKMSGSKRKKELSFWPADHAIVACALKHRPDFIQAIDDGQFWPVWTARRTSNPRKAESSSWSAVSADREGVG